MVLAGLAAAATLAAPAPAPAPSDLPRLFVLQLRAEEGVSASNVRLLDEILLSAVQEGGDFMAFGAADMRAMLEAEQQKQLAGCDDVVCLAEVGGALGADLSLQGSVGALGALYVITLKVVDSRRAQVVARWSETVAGEPAVLVEAIRRGWTSMRAQLTAAGATAARTATAATGAGVGGAAAAGSGAQTTTGTSAGAATTTGTAPTSPAASAGPLAPPPAAVAEETPIYQRWWFWTVIGAVVAGGATATGLAIGLSGPPGSLAVNTSVSLPAP